MSFPTCNVFKFSKFYVCTKCKGSTFTVDHPTPRICFKFWHLLFILISIDGTSVIKAKVEVQAPRLHYVHPTCFEAGKPMEFVACGSNLLQPKFRYAFILDLCLGDNISFFLSLLYILHQPFLIQFIALWTKNYAEGKCEKSHNILYHISLLHQICNWHMAKSL